MAATDNADGAPYPSSLGTQLSYLPDSGMDPSKSPNSRIPMIMNDSKLNDYKMDSNQFRHKMQRLDLESKIRSVGEGGGTVYNHGNQGSEMSQYPYKQKMTPNATQRMHFEEGTNTHLDEINSGQLEILHGNIILNQSGNDIMSNQNQMIKPHGKK